MKSIIGIVEELNQLFNQAQVLTDIEDRYVYSFNNIFTKPIHPMFDIVVRDDQSVISDRLLDWSKGKNVTIIRKSTPNSLSAPEASKISILLDDTKIPEIVRISEEPTAKRDLVKTKTQLYAHSIQSNITSTIRLLISDTSLTKCLQSHISGRYCTITRSYNGIETWSAKGRMLLIKGLMKGELDYSKKIIDILFTCSECGNCFSECFKQSDFHKAIINIRRIIAEKKLTPNIFHISASNIKKTGDPAATPVEKRITWLKDTSEKEFSKKPDILYWVGCMVSGRTPKPL